MGYGGSVVQMCLRLLVGTRPLDQVCHLCKSHVRVVFPHKINGNKKLDSRNKT